MLIVQTLSGGYGKQNVIKDLSFTLTCGQTLVVMGPNGSGKTTLFKLLLNMLGKTGGSVSIDGEPVDKMPHTVLAKHMAYIPQAHQPTFDYTVRQMVLMGRTGYLHTFGAPSKRDEEMADDALSMFGLQPFSTRIYSQLSGGEMQMVLVARAVCQQAAMILMDEPMMNLDYKNQAILQSAIATLQNQGIGVMMSTHHLLHSALSGAKVLLLNGGKQAAFGSAADVLTKENLQTVYGVPMDVVKLTDEAGKQRYMIMPL